MKRYVSIFLVVFIFLGADIFSTYKGSENKQVSYGKYRDSNNYRANKSVINEINEYQGNKYLKLIREKYILLKAIFNYRNYSVSPFLAIPAIFFWLLYIKDKKDIDTFFLISLFQQQMK